MHTADGDLVIAAYFDDQWRGLCEVLDLEWMLNDDRFATKPARLIAWIIADDGGIG